MIDLLVTEADIVSGLGRFHGSIAAVDGRIEGLYEGVPDIAAAERIDAHGALLVPGAVDMHVHFRDPGFPERESFITGSASAALGGITTVADMPNTRPAVLDSASLEDKRRRIAGRSHVDFALFGAVDGDNLDSVPGMVDAGAIAFKLFMYQRRDAPPAGVVDDGLLRQAFAAVSSTRRRLHVHAENDDLVKAGRAALQASGREDWMTHLDSRDWLAETEAVSRAVIVAEATGVPLHICHLSSARALDVIRAARRRGQDVTAEVTPQHALLDATAAEELGPSLVMVPPVRTPDDRRALFAGLANGDIDVVATDHAPHTREAKTGHPLAIATGLIGVQWSYVVLLTEALRGSIPLDRVVQAMAARPAELLGLGDSKGRLLPGYAADFAVVERSPGRLDASDLASRGSSTPFTGRAVDCRITATVVGGVVQVRDGRLIGQPTGAFVRPSEKGITHAGT